MGISIELFAEHEHIMRRGDIAADWLIRSPHDRSTEEGKKIRILLSKAPRLGEITFHLPKGHGRKARPVTQTLRAISVPISPTEKGQTKKEQPPDTPPSIDEIIRMIASYGGFLNRKHDGFPGLQTIWISLQRCKDLVSGVKAQKVVSGRRR